MKTVWKYELTFGETEVYIPRTAEVIHVDKQPGVNSLIMWVLLDPSHVVVEPRIFKLVGTGWDMGDMEHDHVGTWVGDIYVWHIFEVLG